MLPYLFLLLTLLHALPIGAQPAGDSLDVEAHAGGRGTHPGNSIPAFIHAVTLGVTTLEMDCVISQDGQVVVSHDPFMNARFMLTPSGQEILPGEEETYNLFRMPYDSIRRYQLGVKPDAEFPEQKTVKTYKPLLSEVIDSVETYVRAHQLKPVRYNIEIKSYRDADHYNPDPKTFAERVVAVVKHYKVEKRVYVQSFDVRPLQYTREQYPMLSLSYLISKNDEHTLLENLEELGFTPEVYSPEYPMVDSEMMKEAKKYGMKIVPWTVDREADWRMLVELGVDGIITNYPEKLLQLITEGQAKR